MPQYYSHLPPHLSEWALAQSIFFTASAPTYGQHINLSPKGVPAATFAVLDEHRAAYLDLTGSGAETISHIYENGRVTVMFCSFAAKPRILRLYCTGRVVEQTHPEFAGQVARMKLKVVPGTRAVVLLDIWKVQTSCGYGVPTNDQTAGDPDAKSDTGFQDRRTLENWLVNKLDKDALDEYKTKLNSRSLDGLPALQDARRSRGEWLWVADAQHRAWTKLAHPFAVLLGVLLGILLTMACLGVELRAADIHPHGILLTLQAVVYRLWVLARRGLRTVRRVAVPMSALS